MLPLKSAMPHVLTGLVRKAPLSPGKIAFAWSMAVGPAVARNTAILLENGLLLVDAASPQWASEVRRSSRIIIARLQAMLGEAAVARLEVRVR